MKAVVAALCLLAPLASNAEPVTLKGLAPGMTKAQIEEAHKGITRLCTKPAHRPGGELCGYSTKKGSLADIPALDSFAGVPATMWLVVLKDGVATSVGVNLESGYFERVAAALTERWGSPASREASVVANRMGAQFDQVEAKWRIDGSVLIATKRGSKVDEMRVTLTTSAAMADADRERREVQPKKDAADL